MSRGQQFWLVWRVGGGAPTYQHWSEADAAREAQRLARAHPGKRFVVMEAVRGFIKTDLQETAYRDDAILDEEIPF